MFRRLTLPGFLLAGAMAFMAAPSAQIQAAECGGPGTSVCKTNESCLSIIFYRQCTTVYDYWQGGESLAFYGGDSDQDIN